MQRHSVAACAALLVGSLLISSGAIAAEQGQPRPPADAKPSAVKTIAEVAEFSEWVTSLAWAPDGRRLAIGSYEAVKLWNAESKKIAETLEIKAGFIKGIAWSPDGKLLAIAGYQLAEIRDAATLSLKFALEGHTGYVTGIAFSADGTRLATSSEDETIRIWNAADGREAKVFRGHIYPVNGIAISPDGQLIASASGDPTRVTKRGEVKLWDATTGKEIATFENHAKAATSVAFSPDGKQFASTGIDEKVIVHDTATAKPIGEYDAHSRPTNCVVFTPDSRTIVSGSGGRAKGNDEVHIWDWQTGKERAVMSAHSGPVVAVALAPDGKTLATASHDQSVGIWDLSAALSEMKPEAVVATNDDSQSKNEPGAAPIRIGIIGLDTSHAIAFTKDFNAPKPIPELAGFRVVAAYPKGSPDIESSVSRVPMYIKDVQGMGVEIVDSIEALLEKVDVVLLETNDGRPHLEQVLPVFRKGKRVFIDKPIAGSLTDAVAIFEASRQYKVPVFSSSSLRYGKNSQAVRAGKIGKVTSAETYSPCSLEKTHPDLFWYGIHGVESLFTVMRTGCVSVQRTVSTASEDVVVGSWEGGRTGTFHGYREGKGGYGGTAEGTEGKMDVGDYGGYTPLVVEIAKFFRTGKPPVSEQETLEIYAFMEAADESKRQNGATVTLASVLKKARAEAEAKLAANSNYDNQLTAEEKAAGWQLLFNGVDYTGWKCNDGKRIASPIEEQSLVPHKSGGYLIIHEKQFGDFTLKCDVKMDAECNSGVFFRIGEPKDPVQTGFEVQVSSGKGAGYHDFGAIYDLVKPAKNNAKPAGEWNAIAITCVGPKISVEINGEKVSEINCDEWTEPGRGPDGRKNKFAKAVREFPRIGYIGFQDHGHKVWFKNVKILDRSTP